MPSYMRGICACSFRALVAALNILFSDATLPPRLRTSVVRDVRVSAGVDAAASADVPVHAVGCPRSSHSGTTPLMQW